MNDSIYQGEITVIQKTLKKLYDDGLINVKDVSRLTGIDDSAIYRWMNAGVDPSATRFLQVFNVVAPEAQQSLLNLLVGGTPWNCFWTPGDADLDVTGDGKIDLRDAIKATAHAQLELGKDLDAINEAGDDDYISDEEMMQIEANGQAVIREVLRAIAVVRYKHDHQIKRRKLSPLHAGGGAA